MSASVNLEVNCTEAGERRIKQAKFRILEKETSLALINKFLAFMFLFIYEECDGLSPLVLLGRLFISC